MADFKTHLIGGTAASGIAATALLMGEVLPRDAVLGCFALGAIGGLLPDVDLETSIPGRVAFRVVSLVGAFLMVQALSGRYSLAELVLLWLGGYLLLRHAVFGFINRCTVHRGLVHSLPAAAAFALATVLAAHRGLSVSAGAAWLAGLFVGLGFVVHLVLDELYSVDLLGRRLKRSFGTAICLGDRNNLPGTLALYALVAALYALCPPTSGLWQRLTDERLYHHLGTRLWPAHGWFDGLLGLAYDGVRQLL